jgi:hypothetical protein
MLDLLAGLGAVPADSTVVHAERLPAHPARLREADRGASRPAGTPVSP